MRKSGNNNVDSLIIGGGAAGLSAAEELQKKGMNPKVLEANKIGGRISEWVVWQNNRKIRIQSGGEYLHWPPESSRLWRELIKNHSLIVDAVNDHGMTLLNGQLRPDAEGMSLSGSMMRELQQAARAHFEQGGEDMRVQTFLDRQSLHATRNNEHKSILYALLANEYGEDARSLGLKTLCEPESYSGQNFRIRQGMTAVVEAIAKNIHDIETGVRVDHIKWRRGCVLASTSEKTTYRSPNVIVAVPHGILRENKISFDPLLPKRKREAFRSIVPGRITKVLMEFRERFWSSTTTFIRGGRPQLTWAPLRDTDPEAPYLSSLIGGEEADHLARMSPGRAAFRVAQILMQAYQVKHPKQMFINGTVKAWHHEENIRTGYSSIGLGAPNDARKRLAEPIEDTLFFAGEATSTDHPASITGAIESGRRAAMEILQLQVR